MDTFDNSIDELVVSGVLSNEAKVIVQQLMEIFVLKNLNIENMQREINVRLD